MNLYLKLYWFFNDQGSQVCEPIEIKGKTYQAEPYQDQLGNFYIFEG